MAWPTYIDPKQMNPGDLDDSQDLFVERNGRRYAGTHLIIDLWKACHLDNLPHIETALRKCVDVTGATLLHLHLHHFTPNKGISGVAVLAESHISIHTWPERNYAALDIFMCGDTQPERCIEVLQEAFETRQIEITTLMRGQVQRDESPNP